VVAPLILFVLPVLKVDTGAPRESSRSLHVVKCQKIRDFIWSLLGRRMVVVVIRTF
jgi:hypothetical protein